MQPPQKIIDELGDMLQNVRLRRDALALGDDNSSHERLRRLAGHLPPAAALWADTHLLAALCQAVAMADPALFQTFLSHYVLGVGSVETLGDPEAADPEHSLSRADAKVSYMVTEVGQASSHLEPQTRAVFDPGTRCFDVITPDPRAAKFSSVAATGLPQKAVVCARLISAGADHGVYSFLIDITDGDGFPAAGVRLSAPIVLDALPLPYAVVRFDHVRVPLGRWLHGGARIDADGTVHDPLGGGDERLRRTLAPGQGVWATVTSAMAAMAGRSAALAWRFNARRRSNGRMAPGAPILAYRPQQHALFGGLASAFALRCTAQTAVDAWERARSTGSANATPVTTMSFSPWAASGDRLSTYKAYSTQTAAELIDRLQHRCGLSGFFAVNRLAGYLGLARAFTVAGGDNMLIQLDTGRLLAEHDDYAPDTRPLTTTDDPTHPAWWPATVTALQRGLTGELREDLDQRSAEGQTGLDLWNPLLHQTLVLGDVYSHRLAADAVTDIVDDGAAPVSTQVAHTLAGLYGITQAQALAGPLLAAGTLSPGTVRRLPSMADELCDRLQPHLAEIAEALDTGAAVAPSPMEEPDYATALADLLDTFSDPSRAAGR